VENILSRYDINLAQDKIKALKEAEKLISEVYSSAERDIYIREISSRFAVDPKSIKNDVDRMTASRVKNYNKEASKNLIRRAEGFQDRTNPDFVKAPAIAKNEETVLGLMLYRPEYIQLSADKGLLEADMFFSELNRRLYTKICECHEAGGFDFGMLSEGFSQEEISKAAEMVARRRKLSDNGTQAFLDSVAALAKESEKIKNRGENTDIFSVIERRRKENQN
jgi:DNA primase